jgi:hypothetical protein
MKHAGVDMKTGSRPSSLQWLLRSVSCLGLAAILQAEAGTPTPSSPHAPLPPAMEGADDALMRICRLQPDLPQELPMICLVTEVDEELSDERRAL